MSIICIKSLNDKSIAFNTDHIKKADIHDHLVNLDLGFGERYSIYRYGDLTLREDGYWSLKPSNNVKIEKCHIIAEEDSFRNLLRILGVSDV
jgi:hypothetical protein